MPNDIQNFTTAPELAPELVMQPVLSSDRGMSCKPLVEWPSGSGFDSVDGWRQGRLQIRIVDRFYHLLKCDV